MLNTIRDLIDYISIYGDKTATQIKNGNENYKNYTFSDYNRIALCIAAYFERFRHLRRGHMVAIYSENRPEWLMAYFGIVYNGVWAVPLDSKLTDLEVKNLIIDCKARTIFLSRSLYDNICCEPEMAKSFTEIILFEDDRKIAGQNKKVKLFSDIISTGAKYVKKTRFHNVRPSDIASLIYTSGTTGNPKGVLLSHGNFAYQFKASSSAIDINQNDNVLSILPLHHTFQFSVELTTFYVGGCVTYAESLKPNKMLANIAETGVTVLIGVPMLFEKIYEGIMRQIRDLPVIIKQLILGLYYLTSGLNKLTNNTAGKAIFAFIRKKASLLTVKFAVSGAAPLNLKVAGGFETLGLTLLNGYGLTEYSPIISLNRLNRKVKNDSVGIPLEGTEIRIAEKDLEGNGEICIRGESVMKGYYKNPKITKEVIDKDGWLFTGDIGKIDSEGYLYITGRKKNIIVTPGGKNIYPEEIEELINECPYILESLLIGVPESEHSRGEYIYAYIVPNYEYFDTYSMVMNIHITDDYIENTIGEGVRNINSKLPDYKKIRGWRIHREEFPKTSTKKIKRYLYSGREFINS